MATRIPEPESTPEGPAYESRLLDRPDEEVVDQGASFDMRTLMSRRVLLGAGLAGVGSVALVACTSQASGSSGSTSASGASDSPVAVTDLPAGEIPDETAGPYPGDGSNGPDILEESGIERSDIRSSIGADDPVDGAPLDFTLTITDMANDDVPFAGVAVYSWHCDAQGQYSMYSEGTEDESWLRGVQVADSDGKVTFTSIMPGCYAGRWPHIHFEVYPDIDAISDATNAIATSQLAFPEDVVTPVYAETAYAGSSENLAGVSLESDNVFGEDSAALQMATVTGDVDSGFVASLTVRVDTTTEPSGGDMPGGGGEGGPSGPGGEPPTGAPGSDSGS